MRGMEYQLYDKLIASLKRLGLVSQQQSLTVWRQDMSSEAHAKLMGFYNERKLAREYQARAEAVKYHKYQCLLRAVKNLDMGEFETVRDKLWASYR